MLVDYSASVMHRFRICSTSYACPLAGTNTHDAYVSDEGALLPEFGTCLDGSFRGLASRKRTGSFPPHLRHCGVRFAAPKADTRGILLACLCVCECTQNARFGILNEGGSGASWGSRLQASTSRSCRVAARSLHRRCALSAVSLHTERSPLAPNLQIA